MTKRHKPARLQRVALMFHALDDLANYPLTVLLPTSMVCQNPAPFKDAQAEPLKVLRYLVELVERHGCDVLRIQPVELKGLALPVAPK